MTVTSTAQFLATHALLLLAAGIALLGLAFVAVVVAARAASRHREALWKAVDRIVPGRHLLPSAYLAAHLVLALLVVAAGLAFVALADDVFGNGKVAAFDEAFADALVSQTTPAWRSFFVTMTTLGSGYVITLASALVAIRIFERRGKLLGLSWVFSQAGGGLLAYGLKITFERVRPPYAVPELAGSSFSFPSGHAMLTFVFCGMAAYLLIRTRRSWPHAAALAALVLAWCLVMGFSRLYLGQHYASDVIAGLFAGTAWVGACAAATEVVVRRPRGVRGVRL